MAEENVNGKVIGIPTETGTDLATAPVQTEQPKEASTDKVGFVGKVCAGIAVVTGLISLGIKGYKKGKAKAAAKASSNEDIVDAEEPANEDEVSE